MHGSGSSPPSTYQRELSAITSRYLFLSALWERLSITKTNDQTTVERLEQRQITTGLQLSLLTTRRKINIRVGRARTELEFMCNGTITDLEIFDTKQ